MNEKYGIELELMTDSFNKKINQIKKEASSIKEAFDPNDVSGIKINGISQTKKEIKGMSDEFKKMTGQKFDLGNAIELQKYKQGLQEVSNTANKAKQEVSNIGYIKYNPNEIQQFINGMSESNSKTKETKQEIEKLGNETSKINLLSNSVDKLTKSFNATVIKGFKKSVQGIQTAFSKVGSVTSGLKNKIQNVFGGNSIKSGLKSVLKYATALFSIRGIYSILSQSASSWLSSQNAGAQQLSTNIEYLKYSMRKCFCSNYSICD